MIPIGRISAELTFVPPEQGGRAEAPPPWGEYLADAVIEGRADRFRVRFVAGPRVGPGRPWPFELDLADPSVDYSSLQPGTLIMIKEGPQVVARGRVIAPVAILPEAVTDLAYRASNGELAWRRADLPAALAAIVASGQAILGGEVWMALGDGLWDGLIPDAKSDLTGVWTWDTSPRKPGETWTDYCQRTAEQSRQEVDQMRVEEESAASVRDTLFFNLAYITEVEGAKLGLQNDGARDARDR